ncbi:ABC transporter C family member 9-like [Papaver somniferum]|uniref:ABC transporter C family member 9-like n=1 Tax=Papaver somniferum TaxID=3469 RepID=UPI000E6F55E5|nr:ABC transporter C family member 9-like [Papaver somniferum]XP_026431114.1 ABC transporter C family member 9-like [Papaver somniferum]
MFDSSYSLSSWSVGFQLGTPCFWEEVSILVQLGVLGSILICFMKKRCAHGSRSIEEGVGKYPSSIRLGFVYKSALVCSVLIAGTHILMLWMILNGYDALCKSKNSVLCKEILLEISCLITLLLVLNLRHSRSLKLPRVLRVWWILSFILSIVHTTLYTSYIHTNHRSLTIVYYVNFVSLISSTYLVGISINGATGISFITNSTTESLLNKLENHSDGKKEKESPYQRATLLQLITFSWLSPLFKVGYKKPLEQEDVPGIHIKDSAEFLSHSFNNILKQVKETKNTRSPSIYMAIFLFIRKKAAINAFFAVINAGASYVGPYLINDFVAFLTQKKHYSLKTGYIIVLAFISAKTVEVIADRQWVFGARQLGMNLKGVLITHIYKKGLHLSNQSRQSHTSGEIINLMSVDIQRITEFIWYMNIIGMLPIQISLATCILYLNLGLSSYAGLAATLMVMLCTIPLQRIQKRLQSRIMEAKDERMNCFFRFGLKEKKTIC